MLFLRKAWYGGYHGTPQTFIHAHTLCTCDLATLLHASHPPSPSHSPLAGWYSLTLWVYPTATTDIRLLWTTPVNSQWNYPTNFFWTVNDDKPTSRNYDPNAGPRWGLLGARANARKGRP